jgi:hypothetical protein
MGLLKLQAELKLQLYLLFYLRYRLHELLSSN